MIIRWKNESCCSFSHRLVRSQFSGWKLGDHPQPPIHWVEMGIVEFQCYIGRTFVGEGRFRAFNATSNMSQEGFFNETVSRGMEHPCRKLWLSNAVRLHCLGGAQSSRSLNYRLTSLPRVASRLFPDPDHRTSIT